MNFALRILTSQKAPCEFLAASVAKIKPLRGAIERMLPFGGCLCGWWHRQCRPATEGAGDEGRDGTKFGCCRMPPVDNEYSSKVDSLILMQHAHTVNPYIGLSSWMVHCFSHVLLHFPENLDSWWEWKAHLDSSPDFFAMFCHPSGVFVSDFKIAKIGKTFRRALRHPIGRSHQLRSSVLR